jgi:hypothetical protein
LELYRLAPWYPVLQPWPPCLSSPDSSPDYLTDDDNCVQLALYLCFV